MNHPSSNQPASSPDEGAIRERAATAVKSHQRKIRALTIAAFVFGFLSVAASITIVTLNSMYVVPKQQKLISESSKLAWPDNKNEPASVSAQDTMPAKLLALEIQMMRVVSLGSMMVAGSVGFLALGTVVLVTVVTLNRRATLNQVSASLAQISEQLRQLRGN
jgi:hypothetical protein